MRTSTLLSFIRHGQVHNPDKIFYGRMPGFRLDSKGRREARQAADTFCGKPVAAIFSSPLLRARQTAREILSFHPHLQLRISGLLTEVFSAYEGHPSEEIHALNDDIYSGVGPPFEQPSDICKRVQKFIARVRKLYPEQHTVAVTHGDLITFMLLWARGKSITPANKVSLDRLGILPERYPSTGSITTLTYTTDSPDERPAIKKSPLKKSQHVEITAFIEKKAVA